MIKARRCPSALVAVGAVLVLCLAPNQGEAQQLPGLDHFKCYLTQGPQIPRPVLLKDQFTPAGAIAGSLVQLPVRFCNPVEKTNAAGVVTPIEDPNAHLTLYRISSALLEPHRLVLVRNQFGRKRVRVFNPGVLAVPTAKNTQPPPANLDHFKCYQAYGAPVNQVVTLKDQFHTEQVTVRRPYGFCNPVEKTHDGVTTPIRNPEDHLLCYQITPRPVETTGVLARDQFGAGNLPIGPADILCVPSQKLRVSVVF